MCIYHVIYSLDFGPASHDRPRQSLLWPLRSRWSRFTTTCVGYKLIINLLSIVFVGGDNIINLCFFFYFIIKFSDVDIRSHKCRKIYDHFTNKRFVLYIVQQLQCFTFEYMSHLRFYFKSVEFLTIEDYVLLNVARVPVRDEFYYLSLF